MNRGPVFIAEADAPAIVLSTAIATEPQLFMKPHGFTRLASDLRPEPAPGAAALESPKRPRRAAKLETAPPAKPEKSLPRLTDPGSSPKEEASIGTRPVPNSLIAPTASDFADRVRGVWLRMSATSPLTPLLAIGSPASGFSTDVHVGQSASGLLPPSRASSRDERPKGSRR